MKESRCTFCAERFTPPAASIAHLIAGDPACPECHARLSLCTVCHGTGCAPHKDPCTACGARGYLDDCPYTGRAWCEEPCAECEERARLAAEDRTELAAKGGGR